MQFMVLQEKLMLEGPMTPWKTSWKNFMKFHKTGDIRSDAYSSYEHDLGSWVTKDKYPVEIDKLDLGGQTVEIRMDDEPLKYTKLVMVRDKDGEEYEDIAHDKRGLAIMMTDEEARAKGFPLHSANLAAFVGDRAIAVASNEWGTAGIWVIKDWQKKGLGTYLTREFMKRNPRIKRLGQMTPAGTNMATSWHRSMVRDALMSGKPVPKRVLADYPDLVKTTKSESVASSGKLTGYKIVASSRTQSLRAPFDKIEDWVPGVENNVRKPQRSRSSSVNETVTEDPWVIKQVGDKWLGLNPITGNFLMNDDEKTLRMRIDKSNEFFRNFPDYFRPPRRRRETSGMKVMSRESDRKGYDSWMEFRRLWGPDSLLDKAEESSWYLARLVRGNRKRRRPDTMR